MFRILHIDDEELIRTYLEDIVLALYKNVEICGFSSWAEAKEAIKVNDSFDLVLLDEVMPFMNGSEILNILSVDYPALAEKVVFVAGPSNIENYEKPHVEKPFDLSSIRNVLDKLVGSSPKN